MRALAGQVAVLTLLVSLVSPARGDDIDVALWHPTSGADGYLGVDGATVQRNGRLSAGVFVNFAKTPLSFDSGNMSGEIVENSVLFDVVAAYGIGNRLQLGVNLPVVGAQEGTLIDVGMSSLSGAGLGDVRGDLKLRLIGETDGPSGGLSVAVAVGVIAPTGNADLASSGAWGGRPRLLLEGGSAQASGALMAGAILRSDTGTIGDLTVEHEAEVGIAARVRLGKSAVSVLGELVARKGISGDGKDMPVEGQLGARWRAATGLDVTIGGGAGLTDGYGTPELRVLVGVRYATAAGTGGAVGPSGPRDSDGDGVFDLSDRCPSEEGTSDNNGCPEEDTDGDTFADRVDNCPNEVGIPENNGCPDKDGDADTIVDRMDRCPLEAGVRENGGCPDTDGDNDGVADRLDNCREVPGVKENRGCPDTDTDGDGVADRLDLCEEPGPADNDGCPLPDKDGDGLAGAADKCPDEPETFNGNADDDGCPDKGKVLAVVVGDKIEIKDQIFFETRKSKVKKKSYKLLATVAKMLILHPEITKLRIEGHTDDKGKREKNIKLSQERADTVRSHLIEVNGIDANRLEAQGFGPDKPIADNKRSKGRKLNRRVDFVIVERAGDAGDAGEKAPAPATP